jgi:hypothetical protein
LVDLPDQVELDVPDPEWIKVEEDRRQSIRVNRVRDCLAAVAEGLPAETVLDEIGEVDLQRFTVREPRIGEDAACSYLPPLALPNLVDRLADE